MKHVGIDIEGLFLEHQLPCLQNPTDEIVHTGNVPTQIIILASVVSLALGNCKIWKSSFSIFL